MIFDEELTTHFNLLSMFFISDIHRRHVMESRLKAIKGDIIVIIIGRDITEKGVPLERTKENLEKLKKWNLTIYFVWGNNDYEEDPESLYHLLVREGITILANTNIDISIKNQVLSFVGLDCCTYREARGDLALEFARGDYTILLTHDPSAFYELKNNDQKKIHTVLAGHTHGGQIRLFGLGIYQSGGHRTYRQTNIFVSEGYGYTKLPFRLGTKAECHVITFKNN